MNKNNVCLYLIHGGPGFDDSYFYPFLNKCNDMFDIYSHTLGESLKVSEYNINKLCEELLLKLAGINHKYNEIILLGHSFGSSLILNTLSKFDTSKLNISFIIFSNWIIDNKWIEIFYKRNPEVSDLIDLKTLKKNTLQYLDYYFVRPKKGKDVLSKIKYNDDLYDKLNEFVSTLDLWKSMKNIKIPIYSISSTFDKITPLEYIKSNCKKIFIENYNIPNTGHFPFVEDPDCFKNILQQIYCHFKK